MPQKQPKTFVVQKVKTQLITVNRWVKKFCSGCKNLKVQVVLKLGIVRPCVVYRPPTRPNMPFQRWQKCIFCWHGQAWLTIWDRVKIPWCSHKLMHRKRVTCELHDSKSAYSDGQLWGDIEWALNYYITRWRQEVS